MTSNQVSPRRACLIATGGAVPDKVLSNADLEKLVETSDEWITTRTGIKTRRVVSDNETTASLGLDASRQALDRAGLSARDLDLIICSTITPEMVFPSTACFIQAGLDNCSCCAFDLAAACSGFTYAVSTAASFIASGQCRNALVVGSETLSRITNYRDRTSCILFGDGAGALLLQARENTDKGVLYSAMHADGSSWETLSCQAYGSRFPVSQPLEDPDLTYMIVRGRETYQLAVRRIIELIDNACTALDISQDDIAMIIPHQMNARIIESVVKRLKLPPEKMFVNIDRFGNTSSASIAIALDEAVQQQSVKTGDLIILVSFGAGLTWAINVIRL